MLTWNHFRIPQPKVGKPVAVGFSIIEELKKKICMHEKDHPEKVRSCKYQLLEFWQLFHILILFA